jgi:hypothetical protein
MEQQSLNIDVMNFFLEHMMQKEVNANRDQQLWGEFDTCNNCFSLIVFPDEKIRMARSHGMSLSEIKWDFERLEIILPNGKIVADRQGIPKLFGVIRENFPSDYILTIE